MRFRPDGGGFFFWPAWKANKPMPSTRDVNLFGRWRKAMAAGGPDPLADRPIVYKQFDAEIAPPDPNSDDRQIRFTITTSSPDREHDVVAADGVDTSAYMKNPVVLFAHDYHSLPIGRATQLASEPTRIIATTEFASAELNPMADQVYRMIRAGFLRAVSIGFRPLEWAYDEDRGGVNFQKVELLEYSIVPVPANAEALIAARAAGIDVAVLKDWASRVLRETTSEPTCAACGRAIPLTMPRVWTGGRVMCAACQAAASSDEPSRWNKALPEAFDVTSVELAPSSIEQALAAKYCGCAVKALSWSQEPVYSTRMGAWLTALDEQLKAATIDDLRNVDYRGQESPPLYDTIQLNSTRSQEFLIDGMRFLSWRSTRMAVRVEPRWFGLMATVYVARGHVDAGNAFVDAVMTRARELNFLKGEAFALSGEFLPRDSQLDLGALFLDEKNADAARRTLTLINERGAELENRGLLLVGPPGTGKTLLGRILLAQAKATFVWVSARDFYYGGGFNGMAEAFDTARDCAPTILFVEDVDNWLDGHTVDLLKSQMDGIAQYRGVVTILTTNYPEHLPKALIDRPGRFHDVLRFDLPTKIVRERMIHAWMPTLDSADVARAVKATDGYSGAHIRELARFAEIIADQDTLGPSEALTRALAKLQEQRDLITAVQSSGSRYRAPSHVSGVRFLRVIMDQADAEPVDTESIDVEKPFPHEHACRLEEPGTFDQFRRGTREHEGKTYSVIYGHPTDGGGWREQAYRYAKDAWTASEARTHCASHDGSFEAASGEVAACAPCDEVAFVLRIARLVTDDKVEAMRDACAALGIERPLPSVRDAIGWRAFVKARDRAQRKADEPLDAVQLADLFEDYGFDEEAAVLRNQGMRHFGTGQEVVLHGREAIVPLAEGTLAPIEKIGRVLSKTNEARVRNARDSATHISEQLDEVLASIEREARDDVEQDPAEPAVLMLAREDTPIDEIVLVLAEIPEEPRMTVDADAIAAAVREWLSIVIQQETVAVLNALRGRID